MEGALSPTSAVWEVSILLLSPRIVGGGKLSGTGGRDDMRGSLVWPRSTFLAARGDHWDWGRVSVMSDRVRLDRIHLPTPVH